MALELISSGEDKRNAEADVESSLSTGISSPDLDPKTLKPRQTALKDAKQAFAVFENLQSGSHDRNIIHAKIADKFNGNQPFPDQKKNAQGWKSNFSLLFLAGVVGQVTTSLTSYIENAKSLTQSKLKDETQEGNRKSEILREKFTRFIRRWRGFRSFYASLCQEIVLTGYAFVIRTDEYDWHGRFYRQDEAFVHDGTPPFAEFVQVLALKQDFLIHELTDIIQDREAAKAAKWNVENTVEAINKAIPKAESAETDSPRKWEDAIREGNLGMSYTSGAKTVDTAHVFAIETGEKGKVTHVILDRNGKHDELLWHEKRFESMQDVVTLFTLEPGNNKFYGSKGIGRMLVNYAVAIDTLANRTMDNLFIAGLIVIKWDPARGLPNPKVKVPFLAVHPDADFDQKPKLQATVSEFVEAVNFIVSRAQQAVGAYLSAALSAEDEGKERTAREATIDYQRELQQKTGHIARFAGQLADWISVAQRRACDLDTNEEDAKEFQREVLGDKEKEIEPVVTKEEFKEWANSPAAEVLQDLTQYENQAKIGVAQAVAGNPMVDQKKNLEMLITAMSGGNPQVAQNLILADAIDPVNEVEQFRQQQLETEAILAGASMPVSPRDNHEVHLKQLIPDMAKGAQGLAQKPEVALENPEILDHNHAGIIHGEAHVNLWKQQGATPDKTAPYEQALAQGEKGLVQFAKQLQQMKAQREQQAQQEQMMQQQVAAQQPPQDQGPVGSKEQPLPFTEKVAVAWIGQFAILDPGSRARLEKLTGLIGDVEEMAKHIDNAALDNVQEQAENELMPIPPSTSEPLPPNPAPQPEPEPATQ